MATEKITLFGQMYPNHQAPHLVAFLEFEHPTVQDNKLRFRPAGLKVNGLSMSGPMLFPSNDVNFDSQPQVLSLSARAHLGRQQMQSLGMMSLTPFCLSNEGQYHWDWELTGADIEQIIEKNRHDSDIQLHVHVEGLLGVQIAEKGLWLFTVQGSNHFQLSRATWNSYLKSSGYSGRFVEALPTSVIRQTDPSWNTSVQKLAGARRQLDAGNTYLALEECLSVIEKITSEPYNYKKWTEFLSDMNLTPDSKREAMGQLFGGVGTYLNKVGHHHSRNEKNEDTREHVRPPLDAYEADLLLGITHLMLTYIERLQANKTRQ